MPRMYTRTKRALGLTTSRKHSKIGVKGKKGAKTFKTTESATKYAFEKLKLGEGSFDILPAKKNKKFKIDIKMEIK